MGSTAAHCLNDLAFRQRSENLPIDLVAVVSNHTALEPLAEFYGIPFHHVPVTSATKAQAEARLLELVEELDVELVVLARYMQILSDDLCRALAGRVINIHHSFLPSFKGARPYAQAHDRGVKLIGATAHYVTGDLDEGPIIEQDVERVDHSRARRGPGRARAGRRATGAGAGRALARGAPGAARRAPHDRLPLSRLGTSPWCARARRPLGEEFVASGATKSSLSAARDAENAATTPQSGTADAPAQRSAAIRRSIALSWVVAPVIAARIDS